MEIDNHMVVERRLRLEGRDAKIGVGFLGRPEQFVKLAIGFLLVNEAAQLDLQSLQRCSLFRLGDKFCDE